MISELNGWPACALVNASPAMLPRLAHDSGLEWFAIPFPCGSFIRYSMPVLTGAFDVTFAFVCVDKGSSRTGIFDLLISKGIPFIDVGMRLDRKRGPLNGMLRTTYYSPEDGQKVRDKGFAELADNAGDLYRTNIQIGELNALNACLAVIKFKQLRGFYFEESRYYHLLFEVADLKVVGNARIDED
jgi:hypothetical protein